MKVFRVIALSAAASVALAGAAAAQSTGGSVQSGGVAQTITINLTQQNKSTQFGTATIADTKTGVLVTIKLRNVPPTYSEPAHIHEGTCTKLNPESKWGLGNVENGKSSTSITGVSVAQLLAGKYAINVHLSRDNMPHYVACGNIVKS